MPLALALGVVGVILLLLLVGVETAGVLWLAVITRMPLRVAGIIGAKLPTLLSVLETTGCGRAKTVGSSRRSKAGFLTISTLLLTVWLLPVLWLLLVASVLLLRLVLVSALGLAVATLGVLVVLVVARH